MIVRTSIGAAVAALLLFMLTGALPPSAHSQDSCMSWSEARMAGMLKKGTMRPATEIKNRIEKQHDGKVVSFQICRESGGLIYKLAVFRSDGKVIFVTEPAQ